MLLFFRNLFLLIFVVAIDCSYSYHYLRVVVMECGMMLLRPSPGWISISRDLQQVKRVAWCGGEVSDFYFLWSRGHLVLVAC
jgi:hypothetical protein